MIRDQFKDVKKVTTKEARKKATMGEKNYYAKQIGKLQDLTKSVSVSAKITTVMLALAYALVLLAFIVSYGTKDAYSTVKFVIWTAVFASCVIFTIVWEVVVKPRNKRKVDEYRHELERLTAKNLTKAMKAYGFYGEEYQKEQDRIYKESKEKAEKEAKEKQAEEERKRAEMQATLTEKTSDADEKGDKNGNVDENGSTNG